MENRNHFKEMMSTDFENFKEALNLVEPAIIPQEIIGYNKIISAAGHLTMAIWFLVRMNLLSLSAFNVVFLIEQYLTFTTPL